jgi:hypothetical protein
MLTLPPFAFWRELFDMGGGGGGGDGVRHSTFNAVGACDFLTEACRPELESH